MFRRTLRKRRKLAPFVALAAIFVGSSLYSGSAVASGAPSSDAPTIMSIQQSWSHVPEFTTAPAIQTGHVVDHGGRPVVGATVILFPLLFGPGKGTVIPGVSRAETDSAGRYTLHLPSNRRSELANKWSRDALNLHIMVFYPGAVTDWFVPIPAGRTTAQSAKMTLTAISSKGKASAPDNFSPPTNCYAANSPKDIGPINEIIGYKSVLDGHVNTDFLWSAGFNETTGVGISTDGTYGSISASGTSSITNTAKEAFVTIKGATNNNYIGVSRWYWQEYTCNYVKYSLNRWYLYQWYLGGANGTPGALPVAAGKCTSSKGLQYYEVDNETQQTFVEGAQLSAAGIGKINLSSQNGYSTSADLTYHFDWQIGDYPPICGVNNFPAAGAGPDYIQIH